MFALFRHPARTALAAGLLAVLLSASACSSGKDAVDQSAGSQYRYVQATRKGELIPAAERKQAGPLAGELLSGGEYRLAADTGHVVVLNFLASWCAPCQIETPQFDALYRARKSEGIKFVGLDVKESGRDAARSWIEDKDITFPIVYDEKAKTALQMGSIPLAGLPDTVVVDKQGRVAAVYVGITLPRDLEPVLDALAKEA